MFTITYYLNGRRAQGNAPGLNNRRWVDIALLPHPGLFTATGTTRTGIVDQFI
ncbi:hypothetical protein PAXINDRAFT_13254 [Paxillus involutus ATCC 200175]|uniref:Uncharacterized protein n=1 Tax=Paxillus involutus ATCC 200175 TaxID=664439 RepID=A0A0C9SWH6_PAXIN|nr:hypothetical protein PAXINDRAFT_13254 [Paxillus involutus ATCC 200175]